MRVGSGQPNRVRVGNPTGKPLIGIIGGIASGKSTVASELGKLGCAVIEADVIVRDLLAEDPVRDEIVRLFGRGVLNAAGQVDHKKLADVVFVDAHRLRTLNDVIHARVLRRTEGLIMQYDACRHTKAIVLDMPLLVEVGWADRCDRLIFVDCDRKRRVERAERKGLGNREIEIRENFQISLDKKAQLADITVDNNSDFSTLVRQIKNIFSDMAK